MLEDHRVLGPQGLRLGPVGRHDDQELVAAVGDDGVVVVPAVVGLTLPQHAVSGVALDPAVLPVGGLEDDGVPVLYVHVLPRHGELYPVAFGGRATAVGGVVAGAGATHHCGGHALQCLGHHVRLAYL